MPDTEGLTAQVAVVGAGPVGLTAAIALAQAHVDTMLVGRRAPDDRRTTALLASSVTALETLGVWTQAQGDAAPLSTLRLVDATSRLLRAPEARFEASEIGLSAFGHNIENKNLLTALEARASELPALRRIEDDAAAIEIRPGGVLIRTKQGQSIEVQLAAGADGRNSLCRRAAGIETRTTAYPQVALTCNAAHARAHDNVSTEFHYADGPFTLVPLPGNRSSIVCVVSPGDGEALRGLSDADLNEEFERRSHSLLGKIKIEPGHGYFPLASEAATVFARDRIALLGEAAHRFPPIGAQGLNLGLRDAATFAELVAPIRGGDVGHPELLADYDSRRRIDASSRAFAVELLNRTLMSEFVPLHGARGLGVFVLNRFGPLRRAAMREGVAPAAAQPRLMRGEALV